MSECLGVALALSRPRTVCNAWTHLLGPAERHRGENGGAGLLNFMVLYWDICAGEQHLPALSPPLPLSDPIGCHRSAAIELQHVITLLLE